MAVRQAASIFGVSIAYIYKALIRRRLTGDSGVNPNRGHRPRKLSPDQELALAAHIRSRPSITLAQVQAWLRAEHGISLSTGAIWNAVRRLGLSFKKSPARSRAGQAGRGRPPQGVASGAAVHRSR
jgi:transposase